MRNKVIIRVVRSWLEVLVLFFMFLFSWLVIVLGLAIRGGVRGCNGFGMFFF